ncbi:unnamed protein product [Prunus armeniaca]|uniref:Uncharacterized protein n=1 Tax=Prunus armeniaca TaxID=36596 RepID=A0A6J5URV1_PRUAR|nr:unnamed protein product [Prunus armeniaca]CAB4308392.1 unnamed protein product [Prunus armeniaca]
MYGDRYGEFFGCSKRCGDAGLEKSSRALGVTAGFEKSGPGYWSLVAGNPGYWSWSGPSCWNWSS